MEKDEEIEKAKLLSPLTWAYVGDAVYEQYIRHHLVKNTNLNLNKIYENYPYMGENTITLMSFINDFSDSNETNISENEKEIILEAKLKNGNKYIAFKKLYIDKNTVTPTKLEIEDITQKTSIYILYNEIKINNLQKEDILAFKLKDILNDI